MNRKEFTDIMDKKIKLIRTESNFTQDKMAEMLGISKKTLIEVEKGRISMGWTCAVAVCMIFANSQILNSLFGGEMESIIQSLAFDKSHIEYEKTLGGIIWWQDVLKEEEYRIQQNIISRWYRILDKNNRKICSSSEYDYITRRLNELLEEQKSE